MRAVVQRVAQARVTVDGETVARIDGGFCVLLGIGEADTERDADYLCDKIIALRLFEDAEGKMNLSLPDVGGSLLLVSQFTLYGNCRKGNRPSFIEAASPELAAQLYERFIARARRTSVPVATGRFKTRMQVALVNDGPVTLLLDSADRGR